MVRKFDRDAIPAIYNRATIPEYEIRDGVTMQNFRGLDVTIGFVTIEPDGETNLHRHPWEQIVYVLEGRAEFFIHGETEKISEGDVFFVPPDAEHNLIPASDEPCTVMTTWPTREDYDHRVQYQTEFATEE